MNLIISTLNLHWTIYAHKSYSDLFMILMNPQTLQDQTPQTRHPPGPGTSHVDRHTPVNILPCPKLGLWAVHMYHRLLY